jgi:hypothetical protein
MTLVPSFGVALFALVGCGSAGPSATGGGGNGNGGAAAVSPDGAQVRFLFKADWEEHLGSCAWISEYRLKFAGNPVPVTVPIEVMADALGEYVGLEGRTYKDDAVLHLFSCNQSQTSKQTKQEYGRFGIDLDFEAAKHYTVTLGGSAATVAEDP